jgi:hypothetical protein
MVRGNSLQIENALMGFTLAQVATIRLAVEGRGVRQRLRPMCRIYGFMTCEPLCAI